MEEFDLLFAQFKNDTYRFLVALQILPRKIDDEAFQRIDAKTNEFARMLKGKPSVPKSLLDEIRGLSKIIQAEAPHAKGETERLMKMSNKLEWTFDLILKDQCWEDRLPNGSKAI